MDSFIASILKRWKLVLAHRLIPDNLDTVRKMVAIHTDSRNSVDDNVLQRLMTYVSILLR